MMRRAILLLFSLVLALALFSPYVATASVKTSSALAKPMADLPRAVAKPSQAGSAAHLSPALRLDTFEATDPHPAVTEFYGSAAKEGDSQHIDKAAQAASPDIDHENFRGKKTTRMPSASNDVSTPFS